MAISGRHLQFARATEKTHKPIASVAALTERHCQLQILKQFRRPCRFPDLSLRGPEGAVAISCRQLRFRRWLSCNPTKYCEIPTSLRSSQ